MKKMLSNGMMLFGIIQMPIAIYLGVTRGMGPEFSTFLMGGICFYAGFFLHREFGD